MIDLLVSDKGTTAEVIGQKYKGRVQATTVVVAVGCLLLVVASVGWWMWVNSRMIKVTKEKEMLMEQLGRQAVTEAIVRQVASRVGVVETAIARPKLGLTTASSLARAQTQGLDVVGLRFGGINATLVVTVRGASLSAMEDFAKSLEVKSVTKKSAGIWDQEVIWK